MTAPANPLPDDDLPRRVVVAGGGVAGLEACLALRAYAGEGEVQIDLLAPEDQFEYRPLSVLTPFTGEPAWRLDLSRFAGDQGLRHDRDSLASVDVEGQCVRTAGGRSLPYHALLVAIGARMRRHIPGALTFHGTPDLNAFRRMLSALERLDDSRVVFAVPVGASWPLPLYELALMTAGHLAARGVSGIELAVVTPEPAPLHIFGERASAAITEMLAAHRIELRTGVRPASAEDGDLWLVNGERIAADRVVTLPGLVGRPIDGLPHDRDGFVPVDEFGRVVGAPWVYSAGDLTNFSLKQGGIATQQADVAAQAILAQLGFPIEPTPFRPVLQGVLLTHRDPTYLRARPGGDAASEPRGSALWWPPSKIAGRYLSPYLTLVAGAPRTPELRPSADLIPVEVDVDQAVRAIRSVVAATADDALPAS